MHNSIMTSDMIDIEYSMNIKIKSEDFIEGREEEEK